MTVKSIIIFKILISVTIVTFSTSLLHAGYCTTFNNETLNVTKSNETRNQTFSIHSKVALCAYANNLANSDRRQGLDLANSSLYKRKSPSSAFAIGFFPGFFVHGLGHYYIGDKDTGTSLLAGEFFSGLILSIYVARGLGETTDGVGISTSTRVFGFLGFSLFFGTWAYDFIGAPIKAEKMNKKHGYSIFFYPKIDCDHVSWHLTLSIK